jgi:D-alanyl-D-alanine carboxypeptidase
VQLDAPIGRYLTDLPPWRDSVTVRQLLSHTGGLLSIDDMPGWGRWRDSLHSSRDVLARIAHTSLQFPPGTRHSYSNSGYIILGVLVERITGRPYVDALRSRLLSPLGLRQTTPCYAAVRDWRLGTSGHVQRGDSLILKGLDTAYAADSVLGASGLCATAADVGRFMAALIQGKAIGREGLAEMQKVPTVASQSNAGAGLFRSAQGSRPIWEHSGGSMTRGVSAEAAVYTQDSLVVVALLNADADPEELTRRVARVVLRIPEPVVRDLPIDSVDKQRFLGIYTYGGGRLRVGDRAGRLFALGQRMLYQGGDTLVLEYSPEKRLVFARGADGRAVHVELFDRGMLRASGDRIQ